MLPRNVTQMMQESRDTLSIDLMNSMTLFSEKMRFAPSTGLIFLNVGLDGLATKKKTKLSHVRKK